MTRFENLLIDEGFIPLYEKYQEFTTYDCVARSYKKSDKIISIGLMDSPTRIGIRFPPPQKIVYNHGSGIEIIKEISKKHSYLPTTDDECKELLEVLLDF